jgi:hypothetical protein
MSVDYQHFNDIIAAARSYLETNPRVGTITISTTHSLSGHERTGYLITRDNARLDHSSVDAETYADADAV